MSSVYAIAVWGLTLLTVAFAVGLELRSGEAVSGPPRKFVDITEAAGIRFLHQASPTPKKYLLETMGSGVAFLDYDNDGLLDLYFVNGAPINDPTPAGTVPKKDGS